MLEYGPAQFLVERDLSSKQLAAVAAFARRFYGETPACIEAVGFFVGAYEAMLVEHAKLGQDPGDGKLIFPVPNGTPEASPN